MMDVAARESGASNDKPRMIYRYSGFERSLEARGPERGFTRVQ